MDAITRAATCASVGAAANMFLMPGKTINFSFAKTGLPLWVGVGVGCGVGSYLGTMSHDWIFPALHVSEKYTDGAATAVTLGSTAIANYGVLYAMNPKAPGELGLINVLGVGLAAEVLGTYLHRNFISPMLLTDDDGL